MSVMATAMVAFVVLAGMLGVDAARLSAAKVQAQTAADASALAAAPQTFDPFGTGVSPGSEARRLAQANGARLVRCRCPVDLAWRSRLVEVSVEIDVGLGPLGIPTVAAHAVAEFDPTVWLEP